MLLSWHFGVTDGQKKEVAAALDPALEEAPWVEPALQLFLQWM